MKKTQQFQKHWTLCRWVEGKRCQRCGKRFHIKRRYNGGRDGNISHGFRDIIVQIVKTLSKKIKKKGNKGIGLKNKLIKMLEAIPEAKYNFVVTKFQRN